MNLTEQYDGIKFRQARQVHSKLRIGTFGSCTDKPRMELCENQNGTNIFIRAVEVHGQGVANNPDLFSDTVEFEGTHNYSPHGQLCQLQMNL